MKTEQNEIVRGAKIIGACILVAAGGVGLIFAHPTGHFGKSSATPYVLFVFVLGLWLLIYAWTGRTVFSWLHSLYHAIADTPTASSHEVPSSPKEETRNA